MVFPTATRRTAFFAGMSLSVPASLLGILKSTGASTIDIDSPAVFPFVAIYFLLTALVFVIDVRSIAPKELKTRVPLVFFPTNREGVSFMARVWGRMLVWFAGAVAGVGLIAPLAYVLK